MMHMGTVLSGIPSGQSSESNQRIGGRITAYTCIAKVDFSFGIAGVEVVLDVLGVEALLRDTIAAEYERITVG